MERRAGCERCGRLFETTRQPPDFPSPRRPKAPPGSPAIVKWEEQSSAWYWQFLWAYRCDDCLAFYERCVNWKLRDDDPWPPRR